VGYGHAALRRVPVTSGRKTVRIGTQYTGTWRITEMSTWDRDYIDLVAPGRLTVKRNGAGKLAFGAMEAEVDCRAETHGEEVRLGFSFAGWDEGDEVSGRGWASVDGADMHGWFAFHLGDESTFRARRTQD